MNNSQNYLRKFTKVIVGGVVPAFFAYSIYDGFKQSTMSSQYEIAATRLGFNDYNKNSQSISAAKQHEAILNQLHLLGYLKPQEIWQALESLKIQNPLRTFHQIHTALIDSHANSHNEKFDVKKLRKNFIKNTDLDQQDVMDLILYLSQKSYNRKPGQERNELSVSQLSKEAQNELLTSAKILRLIEHEDPQGKEYDSAWIAGASRVGLLARVIDFKNILSSNPDLVIKHGTQILAGQRELWANIDGIVPKALTELDRAYNNDVSIDSLDVKVPVGEDNDRNQEGLNYMNSLAEKYGIKLDADTPFIQYATKEECPPGRFPNRLYANYEKGETAKLTETLMAKDIASIYHSNKIQAITVIDTQSDKHQRPTTASTARDAAEKFILKIIKNAPSNSQQKNFKILLESNNPYIERQTIAVQREVNDALKRYKLDKEGYTIKIEGVGFGFKQDASTISSEFAALVAEKRKNCAELDQEAGFPPKRSMSNLLYHAYNDSVSGTKSYPNPLEANHSNIENKLSGWFKDIFDKYLP